MRGALLLCLVLVTALVHAGDSATLNNANQWLTTHNDISISNSDSHTVKFNLAQWIWGDHGGDTFYVYVKPNQLPPYVNGGYVNMKFDFYQDPANTYWSESGFDTVPKVTVYGVTNLPSSTYRWYPDNLFNNHMCWYDNNGPCEEVFSQVVALSLPSGAGNAIHVDFTQYVDVWDAAQIVVEIILNDKPSRAGGNDYYFSHIEWTIDQSPNDIGTLDLVNHQKWSSAHDIIGMSNPSNSQLRLQYPQWAYGAGNDGFVWYYWLRHGALPDLESGTTWTLSFDVYEDNNNQYCTGCEGYENAPATHEIILYVVDDLPVGDDMDYWYPTTIQGGSCTTGGAVPYDCTVLASASVLNGIPSGSGNAASVSFTLPNTVTSSMQILMQINLPGKASVTNYYYFNDIQITNGTAAPLPSSSSTPTPSRSPVSPSPSPSPGTPDGVWFNGVNVPWRNWAQDIGGWGYDSTFFGNMYNDLASYGGNIVRFWVHCDGTSGPLTYSNGYVTGLSSTFLTDLDAAVSQAAASNKVIMLTPWSFDMCKTGHTDLINDQSKTQSYIDNALRPMAQTVASYDNVLWDIINEPEWCITEAGSQGYTTASLWNMQRFISMLTNEIHSQTDHLVSVGSASLKWNSDRTDLYTQGNWYKDSALQNGATLDFYQVHYYSWMIGSGYNYSPADFSTSYWGLDKPTMVGEVTGQGDQHYTPLQFAQGCYNNGYIGVLFWSYNYQGTGDGYSWVPAQPALQSLATSHSAISSYSHLLYWMSTQ